MKIVHVIPELGCGGAEILLGGLVLQQKKQGHEVRIVTLRAPNETFKHFPNKDLLLREIPIAVTDSRVGSLWQGSGQRSLGHWRQFIKEYKPDVIHSHLFEADFLAHSILLPQAAYITHFHGPFPEPVAKIFPADKKKMLERLEQRWLHRRQLKTQTHFVAISTDIFEYVKRMVPVSLHENIHLLHNAIDLASFPFQQRKKMSVPVQLVSVGNLVKRKNHAFLIKVVERLLQRGTTCSLAILGYGELEQQLRNIINAAGLKDRIHLAGSVGNVADYLSRADIYIHAAQPEPFGIAILEAMASGLPVVALESGGTKDIIHDGINGFLIHDSDVNKFCERIEMLVRDITRYQAMSEEAGTEARIFDMATYSIKTIQIYEKALTQRRTAQP